MRATCAFSCRLSTCAGSESPQASGGGGGGGGGGRAGAGAAGGGGGGGGGRELSGLSVEKGDT